MPTLGKERLAIELPGILDRYFACETAGDFDSLAACFAAGATVLDEGRTFRGRDAIRQWMADAKANYQHTVLPLEVEVRGDLTVVTARVSGNFPGSPVQLAHSFRFGHEGIESLEIS